MAPPPLKGANRQIARAHMHPRSGQALRQRHSCWRRAEKDLRRFTSACVSYVCVERGGARQSCLLRVAKRGDVLERSPAHSQEQRWC